MDMVVKGVGRFHYGPVLHHVSIHILFVLDLLLLVVPQLSSFMKSRMYLTSKSRKKVRLRSSINSMEPFE